jgi:ligand-binding SRPBCC domain-containing protein
MMRIREFTAELWLPLPPEEVFPFFSDAGNLNVITPPWLKFRVVKTSSEVMSAGVLIDYNLRVHGFPLRWQSRINVWEPPHRFVDEQLLGPYQKWVHEHTFEARDGGTLARDVVRYALPFDFLTHRWFVRSDIEKIFEYRAEALRKRFPVVQAAAMQ